MESDHVILRRAAPKNPYDLRRVRRFFAPDGAQNDISVCVARGPLYRLYLVSPELFWGSRGDGGEQFQGGAFMAY